MCAFFGRGPNVYQNVMNESDAYENYVKDVIKDSPYDISKAQYRKICAEINKEISNMVIEEGQIVVLPHLGEFDIIKYKIKLGRTKWIPTDFKKTLELGTRIINTNEHTNGYKYTFRWSKKNAKTSKIRRYRFIATRANKRRLAYILINRIRDYFERR